MPSRISRLLLLLALAGVAAAAAPEAHALRPPVVWLKGEGNYTKAHRPAQSVDRIVVHVTEGSFWGSVQWLQNPRAHVSSHFVVGRGGKIVQLVHLSDIAWHAGHWGTNVRSVGIEHEGFTYGPNGFTKAQYEQSARLTAWLAKRSLMPIDRKHIIGHSEVPGGHGHTDPGPNWNWKRYLELVRQYAGTTPPLKITDMSLRRNDVVSGRIPWKITTTAAAQRVEFRVNRRTAWVDRTRPFTFGKTARGFDTLRLPNGRHVVEVIAWRGTKKWSQRFPIVVRNLPFRLTTGGAVHWAKVKGVITVTAAPTGAGVERVVFKVNGRRALVDRKAPYAFRWDTRKVRNRAHPVEVVAYSTDGRVATRRLTVVVANVVPKPKPKPAPKPAPAPAPNPAPAPPPKPAPKPSPAPAPVVPPLAITSQSVKAGQVVDGLVLWRVEATGKPVRVEFLIDGVKVGADVAAPYTFGWDTTAAAPGPHRLTARAVGANGKTVAASVTVTVPARPETASTPTP
jgi:N-acetyl-anhydromuramyl-L-alanine amidase AmpD